MSSILETSSASMLRRRSAWPLVLVGGALALACGRDEVAAHPDGGAGGSGATDGGGSGGSATGGTGGATTGGAGGTGGATTGGAGGTGGATTGGAGGTSDAGLDGTADGGGCDHGGTHYPVGASFPAGDGCNTCYCSAGGLVQCTAMACPPDAGSCHDEPIARLCVRGAAGATGEALAVGAPLELMVFPAGCWSSSCTARDVATCGVSLGDGGGFVADGRFCLRDTSMQGGGCTADCSGGGFATCQSTEALTAGQHTVTLGALQVSFTVPGEVPFGGTCDGTPF